LIKRYQHHYKQYKTILIVDDDQDSRALVTHHLMKAGYFVMTAENCKVAFEKITEALPDLMILDNIMPEMFGCELIKEMKSSTATESVNNFV